MKVYGCDEAGKGPVIGSMFVSCVMGKQKNIPENVTDSKNLTTKKIHMLADRIRSDLCVSVIEVSPDEIDSDVMTDASVRAFTDAIQCISYEECSHGYIDSFINNTDTVCQDIQREIPDIGNLVVEFGADETYPIVSAASIIAKSEREKHVDQISEEFDRDIGSGYPSDSTTREFLCQHISETGDVPRYTRKSWSTVDDLMDRCR